MQDRIEKHIELKAPIARVWRAVTDHEQFGEWFKVALEGPFVVGDISRGQVTHPGYEHMKWIATVVAMEPESRFALSWCPYAWDADVDYSKEPQTLVEFKLEAIPTGTRLVISESGFQDLPDDQRRIDALRSNTEGWDAQAENIANYVEA